MSGTGGLVCAWRCLRNSSITASRSHQPSDFSRVSRNTVSATINAVYGESQKVSGFYSRFYSRSLSNVHQVISLSDCQALHQQSVYSSIIESLSLGLCEADRGFSGKLLSMAFVMSSMSTAPSIHSAFFALIHNAHRLSLIHI